MTAGTPLALTTASTLPRISPAADLLWQHPTDLGLDCRCGEWGCIPVATVSWVPDYGTDEDFMVVGRACLPDAVDDAIARSSGARPVAVEVPVWTTPQVTVHTMATYRQVDEWARRGYVEPENQGCGSGRGAAYARRFYADDVHHVRWMAALTDVGLPPGNAHELLHQSPERVEAMYADLLAAREAARARRTGDQRPEPAEQTYVALGGAL